ncbi:hypothetical protein [Pyrococcus horikoshii]|nr:hypothetical protein [Pyrococcus horikoshii]
MRYIESIDYKSAVMFSISLPQLLIVSMITYLLSRYIFKRSSGLNFLVVLITISAEHFIFMLRNPIPNSLGGVYLALVFWSLFKFLNEDISPKVYLLLLIFSFTLSITHSISTIAMFIALGSVFMLLMIHESILKSSRDASKKTFMLIILSGVVVYFWWTYISGHTPKILDILKTGLIATKLIRGYAVMKTKIHFFDLVIGVIPVIIYHILALIGIAILLFRRGIKEIVSDKILALTILIGGSYAVLGSIPRLLGFALLAHRWWYFSEMFLSVPVAIGVSNILIHKSKLIKLMGVITVAIYFTLTLTEPQYVSIDGMSYYEKDSFRYSLILSELQYTNFAKVHNITCVSSDEYYAYVLSILGMKTEEINDELLTRSFETVKCPVIGIRTYMLFHPIKVHQFVYKVPYNPLRILSPRVEWNKIYSSNALNVFRKIYI